MFQPGCFSQKLEPESSILVCKAYDGNVRFPPDNFQKC